MDKDLRLIVPIDKFNDALIKLINAAGVLESQNVKTEDQLSLYTVGIEDWIKECNSLLKNSFNQENNSIYIDFHNATANNFSIPGMNSTIPFAEKVRRKKEKVNIKSFTLYGIKKVINVCDLIINNESVDFDTRAKLDTEEKLKLILSKLYDIHDEYSYSIKEIMIGNGLTMSTHYEDRDFAKILEQNGLIETISRGEIHAQITTLGKLFVEKDRKGKSDFISDNTIEF